MENRFGIKDLILFILVGGLIVLVLLGMKQYDRQWEVVQQTRTKLEEQTSDLQRINRSLERIIAGGISTSMPTTRGAAGGGAYAADPRVTKAHDSPDFAQGDSVIDMFTTPPDKLTPLVSSDLYSYWVQSYVLDSLLDRDPDTFAYVPRLAESWKVSDDGLTIDFTMRERVTFSDGEPLTADDVLFTVAMIQNEKIEAPRDRVYWDKLDRVEKVGTNGVRFIFKEPYFKSFETAASLQILSKKFYSQFTPEEFNNSTGFLIGSGPYRLRDPKTWRPEPGRPIELVRNERYWGEPSGPDRLVWRVIEQVSSRITELRNGGADVYTRPTPEQYDDMKADKEFSAKLNLFSMDVVNSGYIYVGWNEAKDGKPTRFADPRVRRAMTMLIDREAIVRDIIHGYASIPSGPFHHLSPQYDQSIKPWPYDPAAAMKLLTEAGCTKKGNLLIGPDGTEFRFQVLVPSSGEVTKRIGFFIKDEMARAGIIAEPLPVEWSVLLDRTKERKFDAVVMGWGGVIEDDPQQIFHSSAMKGVGDNFVQYSNARLDAAIDKARKTVKDEERMPLWHEVHRILHDDQPYTFLAADYELIALDKRFKGAVPTKLGICPKTEWYVPAAQQRKRAE